MFCLSLWGSGYGVRIHDWAVKIYIANIHKKRLTNRKGGKVRLMNQKYKNLQLQWTSKELFLFCLYMTSGRWWKFIKCLHKKYYGKYISYVNTEITVFSNNCWWLLNVYTIKFSRIIFRLSTHLVLLLQTLKQNYVMVIDLLIYWFIDLLIL